MHTLKWAGHLWGFKGVVFIEAIQLCTSVEIDISALVVMTLEGALGI